MVYHPFPYSQSIILGHCRSTLHTLHFALYTWHSTLCTLHLTHYIPLNTPLSSHSTLCTPLHSTLPSIPHSAVYTGTVTGEECTRLWNNLFHKSVLCDCISMCSDICTINIRVSIRVRNKWTQKLGQTFSDGQMPVYCSLNAHVLQHFNPLALRVSRLDPFVTCKIHYLCDSVASIHHLLLVNKSSW